MTTRELFDRHYRPCTKCGFLLWVPAWTGGAYLKATKYGKCKHRLNVRRKAQEAQ